MVVDPQVSKSHTKNEMLATKNIAATKTQNIASNQEMKLKGLNRDFKAINNLDNLALLEAEKDKLIMDLENKISERKIITELLTANPNIQKIRYQNMELDRENLEEKKDELYSKIDVMEKQLDKIQKDIKEEKQKRATRL